MGRDIFLNISLGIYLKTQAKNDVRKVLFGYWGTVLNRFCIAGKQKNNLYNITNQGISLNQIFV